MKILIMTTVLILTFIFLPLTVCAQQEVAATKNDDAAASGKLEKSVPAAANQDPQLAPAATEQAKTVIFAPSSARDPFLSKEEVESIERTRQEEIQRIEQERKRLFDAEKARLAELEEKKRREEELRKNPAREIINKISIDGILGAEAIVNGKFRKIGDKVLGAQITRVSDTSVTFIYKGQTFVKKMKITGTGVL
jgi:hypothetical protein